MNKQVVQGVLAFVAVCGMGLFIASAGGIQWGTMDAGCAAFLALMIATAAFVLVGFFPRDT